MSRSLLSSQDYFISENISIHIPTIREILDFGEQEFYSITTAILADPYDYRLQLYDMGVKYEEISAYELFITLFPSLKNTDLSLIFGSLDLDKLEFKTNPENKEIVLGIDSEIIIDSGIYTELTDVIRKIHLMPPPKKVRPGNEFFRKKSMERLRQKQERNSSKRYTPILEKIIISLVNAPEFKYDYDGALDLSIFKFNSSIQQIKKRIDSDALRAGVYSGTIDINKIDQSLLDWISS